MREKLSMLDYAEDNEAALLLAKTIESKLSRAIDKYVLVSATDTDGVIVAVSRAFCSISGYTSAELIGQPHSVLRHPDMPKEPFADLWQAIQSGDGWIGEIKNRTKDDGFYWVMTDIDPVLDKNGVAIGYIAVRQDITGLKALETLSITDPMTNAYNRRYFEVILPKELARARREKRWLAFLMVDADNFKRYNDTYGHYAGDDVIKAIIDVMHNIFRRPGDFVFRLGGEEFVALYPVKHEADALMLAETTRQAMYDRNIEHSGNPPINRATVSMGLITLDPVEQLDVEDIYKYSDIALYHAKENGRNRVEIHSEAEPEIELF